MSTINLVPEGFRQKTEKSSNKLIIFPIILIVAAIVIYAGLFIYKKTLSEEVSRLDNEIVQINQEISQELETEVVNFQKHLSSLKKMLNEHIYYSNVFRLIEEKTVSTVSFENFVGSVQNKRIELKGKAISFSSLAKQVAAFKKAKEVNKVNFSSATVGAVGGIDFEIALFLKEEAFRYKK